MQTRSSFNVLGPGGTTYFFRRTFSLPCAGISLPRRIPLKVPLNQAIAEAGYIMRKGKPIWGEAVFDPAQNGWRFVQQQECRAMLSALPTDST